MWKLGGYLFLLWLPLFFMVTPTSANALSLFYHMCCDLSRWERVLLIIFLHVFFQRIEIFYAVEVQGVAFETDRAAICRLLRFALFEDEITLWNLINQKALVGSCALNVQFVPLKGQGKGACIFQGDQQGDASAKEDQSLQKNTRAKLKADDKRGGDHESQNTQSNGKPVDTSCKAGIGLGLKCVHGSCSFQNRTLQSDICFLLFSDQTDSDQTKPIK